MVAPVTRLDVRYVAGLFDGEGCVAINKRNPDSMGGKPQYRLVLQVSMTNERVIALLRETCSGTYSPIHWHTRHNNRTAYQWRTQANNAADLLREWIPHLVVKREEAILAVQFQDRLDAMRNKLRYLPSDEQAAEWEYRESVYQAVRALKKASGALDDKVANSVDTRCPAREGTEGQYRAKQALQVVGAGRV